tara:strand:+ start:1063 stop:1248 length:186 start_codon:yes stop_codon:yes gene_type:complete
MQHLKKIKDIFSIVIGRFWTMIIAEILRDRVFGISSLNTLIAQGTVNISLLSKGLLKRWIK